MGFPVQLPPVVSISEFGRNRLLIDQLSSQTGQREFKIQETKER